MSRIRALVVDDSPTMRSLISSILRRDPEIEVVGEAGDPLEARSAIKALNPDVLTLDVEMPNMTGLDFLERLMRLRPMPVVMVSTLTQAGAAISVQALETGAIDCVGKPDFEGLAEKVKVAARARVRPVVERAPPPPKPASFRSNGKILAIGSSTGGVEALISVLQHFPADCPPTIITQHMPPTFTTSFAARLDRLCAPKVAEARDGAPLQVGQIYLSPGGPAHCRVAASGKQAICRLVESGLVNGHRPSVDVLFESVAAAFGAQSVGLILTGMGRDGAQGLKTMREAGATTIGQDEASCVVYGMPKAAFEIGAVQRQLPLSKLGAAALAACAAEARRVN